MVSHPLKLYQFWSKIVLTNPRVKPSCILLTRNGSMFCRKQDRITCRLTVPLWSECTYTSDIVCPRQYCGTPRRLPCLLTCMCLLNQGCRSPTISANCCSFCKSTSDSSVYMTCACVKWRIDTLLHVWANHALWLFSVKYEEIFTLSGFTLRIPLYQKYYLGTYNFYFRTNSTMHMFFYFSWQ